MLARVDSEDLLVYEYMPTLSMYILSCIRLQCNLRIHLLLLLITLLGPLWYFDTEGPPWAKIFRGMQANSLVL